MSENTNTLFWVITGAVIVLAVFLLINNASNNQLSSITNKFDSTWSEISNKDQEEEDIYSSFPNNYIDANRKKVVVDGLEVGIEAYDLINESGWHSLNWFIKNVSGIVLDNHIVTITFYNKDNDDYLIEYAFTTGSDFAINKQLDLTSGFPSGMPTNYYALVEVRQ